MCDSCQQILILMSKIWTALENEDLVRATYCYFYGQHLCSLFERLSATDQMPKLFIRFKTAINRFNEVIVKKCWISNKKSSSADSFDDSSNADIFCCLLLLQELTPKQLFDTILEKRKSDINQCFIGSKDLKLGLQSFLNILFNTIKCIYSVFYKNNGLKVKTLLHQRYERLLRVSFETSLINDSILSEDMKFSFNDIKAKNSIEINSMKTEDIQNETKNWISFVKSSIEPLLKNLLEPMVSVTDICLVLNEINENLKQTQKMNDWEEFCEELMANYIPLWDEFVISFVIQKIKSIIEENIEKTFERLEKNVENSISNDKQISFENLKVIDFIWDQTNDSPLNLSEKAFAQIPVIHRFCSDFDQSFEYLLNDIKILKEINFKLIKSHQIDEIQSFLLKNCHFLVEKVKQYFESIQSFDRSDETTVLFCAHFLRQMSQTSTHLVKCYESSSPNRQYSWSKAKDLLLSSSYKSFKKVFDSKISQMFSEISGESLVELNYFISNSFVWQKIETTEESEEGKPIVIKIEVPLQISSIFHQNITRICNDINEIVGHTIPRMVALNILSTMTSELVKIYEKANQSLLAKDYPQNVKQTIALQLYFDLLFFKQLLGTTRDESIKINEMLKISALIDKFESFIDPFDLHVFFPQIQTNISNLSKSTNILFGVLIPNNNSFTSESMSKNQNKDKPIHNIMALNSSDKPFILLNIGSGITKANKN